MDPVTLGALGALGLLALTRKQPGAAPKEKPPPKQDAPAAKPDTGLRDLASLANTGIIGVGILASVAASKLGESLTGNKLGATVGMLNATGGTAGNLVATGARELFKVFGGSDEDATATAWQLMATVIGFTATTVVGILMLPSMIVNALIIGPIVGTIEDIARLANGQAGAVKELDKFYNEARARFLGMLDIQFPTADRYQLLGVAAFMAFGYTYRTNDQRMKCWMRRARGFGVDVKGHWQWGYERGMFVYTGPLGPNYDAVVTTHTYLESVDAVYGDVFREYARYGAASAREDEFGAALRDAREVGDVFANVGHYIKAAGQPWGVGQSELSHLLWWRNAGYFEADDIVDGKLVYHGKTFDYKKANGVA